MIRKLILAAVLTIAFAVSAQAALLTGIKGKVSVNTGDGFKPVIADTQLTPGDRVMVGKDSAAQVVYRSGEVITIKPNQALIVQARVPAGAAGVSGEDSRHRAGYLLENERHRLIVGGLIIGAGAAIVYGITRNPASP